MTIPRSQFAGMTDYSGATLPDLMEELEEWAKKCRATIEELGTLSSAVDRQAHEFAHVGEVRSYVAYFSEFFRRYEADFSRLTRELPSGVQQAHVELLNQMYEGSRIADTTCSEFNLDHIEHASPTLEVRRILDSIYRETRGQIADFMDLSNVQFRLKTFVGVSADRAFEPSEALHLKPNIFGVGFNVNYLFSWLGRLWKRRRNKSNRAT